MCLGLLLPFLGLYLLFLALALLCFLLIRLCLFGLLLFGLLLFSLALLSLVLLCFSLRSLAARSFAFALRFLSLSAFFAFSFASLAFFSFACFAFCSACDLIHSSFLFLKSAKALSFFVPFSRVVGEGNKLPKVFVPACVKLVLRSLRVGSTTSATSVLGILVTSLKSVKSDCPASMFSSRADRHPSNINDAIRYPRARITH